MDTRKVCLDAFKNISITTNAVAPCCIAERKATSEIDFANDPYLNTIRQTWMSGEFPKECSSCQVVESSNLISRRIGAHKWYADNNLDNLDVELVRMDYWTGDLCNLRCAICGPHNSSAWKQELNMPIESKKVIVNYKWQDLDLSNCQWVHFTGGEPLLSKEHVKFLKSIPVKKQVHLLYNTNGTVLPTQQLMDLWSDFKLVQLDFSIDDIGQRFEYQRFPAVWNEVTNNLQWFIDNAPVNCMFGVNTTVSILNQANLSNLSAWLKTNFYSNRVTDPIEHKQQQAHGLFSTVNVENRKQEIAKFLNRCDASRGTDWRKTFPELIQIL